MVGDLVAGGASRSGDPGVNSQRIPRGPSVTDPADPADPAGPAGMRAAGTRAGCRPRAYGPSSVGRQRVVTEPPAASILSLAEPENLWTVTLTVTSMSPVPSTLTGRPSRTAPLATRSSTVTSPPCGYSAASRSR